MINFLKFLNNLLNISVLILALICLIAEKFFFVIKFKMF